MKENNDIFLAGDNVLGKLARPMRKKYSVTFIWSHPFSTCGSYEQLFYPFPTTLVRTCTHLDYNRLLRMWSYGFDTRSPVSTLIIVCHSFIILFYFRSFMTHLNTFITGVVIIKKPVHWFAEQIMDCFLYDNGLRHETVKGILMQIWKSDNVFISIRK